MLVLDESAIPTSLEAERALLGGIMLSPAAIDVVGGMLDRSDFCDDGLGRLYQEIRERHYAGQPVSDPVILVDILQRLGILPMLGGMHGLRELLSNSVSGHELYYATEVRRTSLLRQQQRIALEVIVKATEAKQEPSVVRSFLEAKIAAIDSRAGSTARSAYEISAELMASIEAECRHERPRGISTGLPCVDAMAGYFMAGELTLIAARTSIGKTSLAMQFACESADRGNNTLFVSLEMKDLEVIARVLAADASVDSHRIRTRSLTTTDIDALLASSNALRDVPLRIWSPPMATVEQIRSVAKLEKARNGLSLLVVDYVGRVRATDSKRDRHEQVAHISGMLKTIAVELDIPVLALVQLNREADGQTPKLSHLRESGSLEQDADVVMILHRKDLQTAAAELIVAKHRHGVTGSIPLEFDGKATRYVEPKYPMPEKRNKRFDEFNEGSQF